MARLEMSADARVWKQRIRTWAEELGFVGVGFTDAEPLSGLGEELERRFSLGMATPFEEKDIAKRTNPKAVWGACRTVVPLAFSLPLSVPARPGEGILARAAVGEDYHTWLRQHLEMLTERIMAAGWPSEMPRFQVDTGPLVERAFAARAGLGWVGRNQQLIVPGHGSFVALALFLLDQDLPPDEPVREQCGACRKCLEACPAQILSGEHFAANRCLSYLTQSKEHLTPEQGRALGVRVFGCDTCQEVCPHNRARLQEENLAVPDVLHRGVVLTELLDLSKAEFARRFRPTAAGWRGKTVLQRNALIALKNLKDPYLREWLRERKSNGAIPAWLLPYQGFCEQVEAEETEGLAVLVESLRTAIPLEDLQTKGREGRGKGNG